MLKKSPWWPFVGLFLLMVGGIQSLGWLPRPAAAAPPLAPVAQDPLKSAAALRHMQAQPKHWRTLILQH